MLDSCIEWGQKIKARFEGDYKPTLTKSKEHYKKVRVLCNKGEYIGTVAVVDGALTLIRYCKQDGIIFTCIQNQTEEQLGILLMNLIEMKQPDFNIMLVDSIINNSKQDINKHYRKAIKQD